MVDEAADVAAVGIDVVALAVLCIKELDTYETWYTKFRIVSRSKNVHEVLLHMIISKNENLMKIKSTIQILWLLHPEPEHQLTQENSCSAPLLTMLSRSLKHDV